MDKLFDDESDDDTGISDYKINDIKEHVSIGLIPSVGGGRGLFAQHDLPAGFLVLAEMPILIWPDVDQTSPGGLRIMTEMVLSSAHAKAASLTMFPQNISDVNSTEIDHMKDHIGEFLKDICTSRDEIEVLRTLLVLQHNGFTSGFYDRFTLLNHSCDPNCVKFTPSNSGLGRASEVWTTRPVKAGEELCICYVEPMERTSSYISKYLSTQHFFTCCCKCCAQHAAIVTGKNEHIIGAGVLGLDSTFDIELEEKMDNWQQSIRYGTEEDYYNLVDLFIDMWTILENKQFQDNTSTRLKARLYKLISNTAVQYFTIIESTGFKSSLLPFIEVAKAFLIINFRLLDVQLSYLGPNHPDLGGTHTDLAEAIKGILTIHRSEDMDLDFVLELLVSEKEEDFTADTAVGIRLTKAEKFHRLESCRIKSLYSSSKKFPGVFKLRQPGDRFWGSM